MKWLWPPKAATLICFWPFGNNFSITRNLLLLSFSKHGFVANKTQSFLIRIDLASSPISTDPSTLQNWPSFIPCLRNALSFLAIVMPLSFGKKSFALESSRQESSKHARLKIKEDSKDCFASYFSYAFLFSTWSFLFWWRYGQLLFFFSCSMVPLKIYSKSVKEDKC